MLGRGCDITGDDSNRIHWSIITICFHRSNSLHDVPGKYEMYFRVILVSGMEYGMLFKRENEWNNFVFNQYLHPRLDATEN